MKLTRLDYEKLLDEIEKLKEEAESAPIIVEGKKDEIALRGIGISGTFFEVSNGMPLYEFCETVAERYSAAILFTDFDRAGRKLAQRLRAQLEQMGVKVNGRYRLSIMSKLDTHQVENLHKRLAKFRQKAGIA